jgi:uncharacterized protein (DUF697 family)
MLLQQLRSSGKPVIVVMNKIDLIEGEARDLDTVLADARDKLGEPELIPISARHGTNVATGLMPRLIDARPALAVALGRALPAYRRRAANKVIRNASVFNAFVGAQPIPVLDIPFLLAAQARMVLRIAAIFGEPMNLQHARELVATIAGGLALRFLAEQAAKAIPGPGWLISAAVNGTGTWAMGQAAIAYFAGGKQLTPKQLRERYKQFARRPRQAASEEAENPQGRADCAPTGN